MHLVLPQARPPSSSEGQPLCAFSAYLKVLDNLVGVGQSRPKTSGNSGGCWRHWRDPGVASRSHSSESGNLLGKPSGARRRRTGFLPPWRDGNDRRFERGIPPQMTPPPPGDVEWPGKLLQGSVMRPAGRVLAGLASGADGQMASLARNHPESVASG